MAASPTNTTAPQITQTQEPQAVVSQQPQPPPPQVQVQTVPSQEYYKPKEVQQDKPSPLVKPVGKLKNSC